MNEREVCFEYGGHLIIMRRKVREETCDVLLRRLIQIESKSSHFRQEDQQRSHKMFGVIIISGEKMGSNHRGESGRKNGSCLEI